MLSYWTYWLPIVITLNEVSLSLSTNGNLSDEGKLIFTHVLYRHGDRMPLLLCPTDPWNKLEYWPNSWGELSNLGVEQHYALGKWLRQRYDALLSPIYKSSEIYVRSTDTDRSIMSAQANLAGLFPPTPDKMWNTDIKWQPIPVHTAPPKTDYLMGKADCSEHEKALSKFMLTKEVQELQQRSQHMFDYYTKHCGRAEDTLLELHYMHDKFYIEELYNKTLPGWARPIYGSDELEYVHYYMFTLKTRTRQMARLKGGPLIKDMLERMRDKAKGVLVPDRSVWIYSGHDTTIANVLNSLNMFEFHRPGYASALMVELYLDAEDKPYVSIVYKKNATSQPLKMAIPNCGTACPLEQMFTLYGDILPDNIAEECNPRAYNRDLIPISTVLYAVLAMIVIIAMIFCVAICRQRQRYSSHNGRW